jgi:Calcineurin-like phosphoesterase
MGGKLMKTQRTLILLCGLVFLIGWAAPPAALHAQVNFTGPELLGRPTNHSVTVNVVADTALQAYFKYGTSPGVYPYQTTTVTSVADEPIEVVMDGLTADTKYYYRMVYSEDGGSTWVERNEHSFHTQRPTGSTFTFTIITDSHMNGGGGNVSLYEQALENANEDHPDFHFDLGDTFWIDGVTSTATANQRYLNQRQWMGTVSHSAAVFLAPGNHENEEGWNFDDINSKALLSLRARERYYPNPVTDGFYSGNDDPLPEIYGGGLREDYYAWTWGDALFVVFDPFQYTMTDPYGTAGGEDNDEGTPSHDRWDWTLGKTQYDWLKQVLENSHAKYKFIFAHHMLGGLEDYVRGGAAAAHMFEWGGYDIDGTTWGFERERPGWGNVPIHQLMVANHVSAFFYGHDHLYAYQMRDGVVYQEVPSGGLTGQGLQSYYNNSYTLNLLPSPGHLRVTVSPEQATVDYVYTTGQLAATYTIEPSVSQCQGDFAPSDGDVDGADLATWMGGSTGISLEVFAADYGRTDCP